MTQPNPDEAEKLALAADRIAPRLIHGIVAKYAQAEWPGENTSGLTVYGKNVLIRMDQVDNVQAPGRVLLPDNVVDIQTAAATTGCIYEIGPEAFRHFDDGAVWVGNHAKVGDRVYVEKFSGIVAMGQDGGFYRIMNYNCIAAGLAAGSTRVEG